MKIIDINGSERDCLEVKSDLDHPGFVKVSFASLRTPKAPRIEWYPIADFIARNSTFADSIGSPPPPEVTGIVTKTTKTALTDNTQNWTPNIYKNFTLWISRGTGEGQIRTITKNTHNTAHIDKPWNLKPDKTSQYVISTNVHDPMPQGNTLPEGFNP
jgi:hypothetical protein